MNSLSYESIQTFFGNSSEVYTTLSAENYDLDGHTISNVFYVAPQKKAFFFQNSLRKWANRIIDQISPDFALDEESSFSCPWLDYYYSKPIGKVKLNHQWITTDKNDLSPEALEFVTSAINKETEHDIIYEIRIRFFINTERAEAYS